MTTYIYSYLEQKFFCIKPQVPQTCEAQISFTSCFSEALCGPATPQCALWRDDSLQIRSYPTAPSSLLPKGSGNSWFHSESFSDNRKPSQSKKSFHDCFRVILSPFLGKSSSGSPLHGAQQQSTFVAHLCCPWDGEAPDTAPSRTSSCAFTTRHCSAERPLPPGQCAPSQSSSALSFSPPLFHSFIFARLAKN